MAARLHARTCFGGYREPASVPDRPCHPGGVLRLGWVQRRARHAHGHQYLVFPRPRRTGAGPSVYFAGARHDAHPGVGHAGRVARAAEDFIPEAAMNGRIFSVVGGMFLLTVCSKGDRSSVQAAPPAAQPAAPAADVSAAGGTITGKIKFTGTAPRNPAIDMTEEAACKAKYTTPPTEENVVAGPANALSNVFVYVSAGVPAGQTFTAPTTPVVLDQNGCRYHPHVFGIMVGQNLEIRNSDPLLHNIKALAKKNRGFNVSQPNAGMTKTVTFAAPEVMVNL